jgi:hypothetical protein
MIIFLPLAFGFVFGAFFVDILSLQGVAEIAFYTATWMAGVYVGETANG